MPFGRIEDDEVIAEHKQIVEEHYKQRNAISNIDIDRKDFAEFSKKFDNQIYKQLKQELAQVQKEEQELDRTRHLPLYSSKAAGYRFYCSSCWDKAYLFEQELRKKKP